MLSLSQISRKGRSNWIIVLYEFLFISRLVFCFPISGVSKEGYLGRVHDFVYVRAHIWIQQTQVSDGVISLKYSVAWEVYTNYMQAVQFLLNVAVKKTRSHQLFFLIWQLPPPTG